MFKKIIFASVSLATLSLFSGCATIVSGSPKVSVSSDPANAQVRIEGETVCHATPCKIDISSIDDGDTMVISKDGYKSSIRSVGKDFNGWFWGNIIFGGFLGSTTDGISGATHVSSPKSLHAELRKED